METKLSRIAEISNRNRKEVFTSLYHLLNKQMLLQCHKELDGNKAAGIDGVTKQDYELNLEENLDKLIVRLKNKAYIPKPVKRVYIPKGDGTEKRPLGIPAYEDKIVQMGLKKLLEAVYEPIFLQCSYGFRPKLSCHDALKELSKIIENNKVSYVVDADIRGFFNNVDHDWLIKCVRVKIADPNIIRLITKFLKAGIMESGEWEASEEGTPQGSIVSPVLANIYLHYVLDLWFEKAVKTRLQGEGHMIRYADDFVCCFQYKEDTFNFYRELKGRFQKFGLEIAENKSKVIEFGRFAQEKVKRIGKGKPESFDFLGFTHYCSKNDRGNFRVKKKTSKKKFKAKIKEISTWIKTNRHVNIAQLFKTIGLKLKGHYNYYGVTFNSESLYRFYFEVEKILHKWLNRRSQKRSLTFEKFRKYVEINSLPKPQISVNMYDYLKG
jgi:RNA-directed DNA polymerase